MKREHFEDSDIPSPLYWFPFTENANDVMDNFSGWTTNNLTQFTSNGAYFNGSRMLYKSSTGNKFSDFSTMSMTVMLPNLLSSVHTLMIVKYSSNTVINLFYAPSWNQDINFSVYNNGSAGTGSLSSVPLIANTDFTITVRQNSQSSNTDLFVNGVKRGTAAMLVPGSTTVSDFCVGYRNSNYDRYLTGYVKDLMFFKEELTDEQIAMI